MRCRRVFETFLWACAWASTVSAEGGPLLFPSEPAPSHGERLSAVGMMLLVFWIATMVALSRAGAETDARGPGRVD